MSNRIIGENPSNTEKYISKHSKSIKIPDFKLIDAKIHPQNTNHIVVLSKIDIPDNLKMSYVWDPKIHTLNELDSKYPEIFKEELNKIKRAKRKNEPDPSKYHENNSSNKFHSISSIKKVVEETKNGRFDEESDNEGGEGEDEKSNELNEDAQDLEYKNSTDGSNMRLNEEEKSTSDPIDKANKNVKNGVKDSLEDEKSVLEIKEIDTNAPNEDESKNNSNEAAENTNTDMSLSEEFDLLNQEDKQKMVNNALDRVILSEQNDFRYNYHGFEERFKREGYQIPDNEKPDFAVSTAFPETDFVYWNPKQSYKTIEYEPSILREKYQLSLWKTDANSVHKIKDRYFTPRHKSFSYENFYGFSLKVSLDNKSIYLVEESEDYAKTHLLVLIIDSGTLEITKEIMVKIRDPELELEDSDEYYDNSDSKFGTLETISRINVTNNGKNIIVGVTKGDSKVHYCYAIYNSESGKMQNKIFRTQESKLSEVIVCCIKQNPDNSDEIVLGMHKGDTIEFSSINMINGNSNVISRNDQLKGGTITKIEITDSLKTIHVVYREYVNEVQKSLLYKYDINKHPKIDPINQDSKATTNFSSYSSHSKTIGESFCVIQNNDSHILEAKVIGEVNYSKAASDESQGTQYYDIKDFSLLKDGSTICISKFTEDELQVEVFPCKQLVDHYTHQISEITCIKFDYPNILIVKGCTEILTYSITEDLWYYLKLGAPFVVECSSILQSYTMELRGLVDLGDYFAYFVMSCTIGANAYFSGTFYKRYIEKSNLPKEKILTCLDICKAKVVRKDMEAIILQFRNYIFVNSTVDTLFEMVESTFKLGEIIHIPYTGIITWSKDRSNIHLKQEPVNLFEISSETTVYDSVNFIKSVKIVFDQQSYKSLVYICDETKYLKIGEFVKSNERYQFNIQTEYYVNDEYLGDSSNFVFSDKILYDGFRSYLCQERGKESSELALICEPDNADINSDKMSPNHPLLSKSWLMFYGKSSFHNSDKQKNVVLLLPQYNHPKIQHLNPNDTGYYKAEYFCYHDMSKLVYHKQMYELNYVALEIYNSNGDLFQLIKLKIEGCNDYYYAKVLLSPSGRYIFYVEEIQMEPDDPTNYDSKTTGKICELVFDPTINEFVLETKRTIEDFKERYDKSATDVNFYNYYSSFEFYLTDNMELLYVNKDENIVMYEDKHLEKQLQKKLGK